MCQHCCRMEWTPCAPIPYACPLCPVRQVADLCDGPDNGDRRRRYRKNVKRVDNQMCRGISELYTHVVAAKRNAKNIKRRGRKSMSTTGTEIRLLPRMAQNVQQQQQQQQTVQFRLDQRQYIDSNIPVLYRETSNDPNTWTWASRYPDSEKVLPVNARMASGDVASNINARNSPCRCLSNPYD
ncbi:hypothetical protein ACLKA6_019549 [Drosophila palustris]